MWQHALVFVIVGAAALYAIWRGLPAPWRQGVAQRLARGAVRAGIANPKQAQEIAQSLARGSGCGACDSCGSCSTPPRPAAQDADQRGRA